VDFGKKPAANLECLLATDRKGVKVQLIDITGDCPQRVLAEFKPEPGEWFEFRRCRARLKEPVSGKRKVLFKVLGDRCNFRGWRMVQREKVK
jgi:hypothetical protein